MPFSPIVQHFQPDFLKNALDDLEMAVKKVSTVTDAMVLVNGPHEGSNLLQRASSDIYRGMAAIRDFQRARARVEEEVEKASIKLKAEMEAITPEMKAQSAYEKYTAHSGNKNFRGEECPKWAELPEEIRGHWVAAVS